MYINMKCPIIVLQGDAAKKIFDKPKKEIPNRYEIIKKAREELRNSGYKI